jgi:transcriptional regulator with XRE-family HTH domain
MTSSGERPLSLAVANRILELKKSGESDAEFGRRIGLTPQVLSNYRSRLHGASLDAVAAVATNTRVNLQWLLMGEGAREQVLAEGPEAYIEGLRDGTDRVLSFIGKLREEYGLPSSAAPLSEGRTAPEPSEPLESPSLSVLADEGAGPLASD